MKTTPIVTIPKKRFRHPVDPIEKRSAATLARPKVDALGGAPTSRTKSCAWFQLETAVDALPVIDDSPWTDTQSPIVASSELPLATTLVSLSREWQRRTPTVQVPSRRERVLVQMGRTFPPRRIQERKYPRGFRKQEIATRVRVHDTIVTQCRLSIAVDSPLLLLVPLSPRGAPRRNPQFCKHFGTKADCRA